MKVVKTSGESQEFCLDKITRAISLANNSERVSAEDRMDEKGIAKAVKTVQKMLEGFTSISVDDIHDMVERALYKEKRDKVAKAYIIYREEKKKKKKYTDIEEQVLCVVRGDSELRGDNANKRIDDNPSMRDYIAGATCKSIAMKELPKDIVSMHKKGLLHWHDADYSPVQPMHNCDLVFAKDMFEHTFQMGDTLIECNANTPFETACNLLAQINLQVSGRQYGGQTVSWADLLPFVANSRRLIKNNIVKKFKKKNITLTEEELSEMVEEDLREEIYKGVKTYQYQVLCHSSSNGQTPFVSNNLCLREAETQQELDDFAMIIEEILKRRIKGVKDSSGHYVSPLFPKLLYWTCDGLNVKEDDPYFYLTELAAECESKRSQPDIVSEKQTRKVKKGQIIPSMGCRSLLAPIWEEREYPVDTKFYWVEGTGTYPYGTFVEKRSFEDFENGEYATGYDDAKYAINFRGNTGWLKSKTDTTVTILEPKVYGRWNNGVITLNIPHVALEANEEIRKNTPEGATPSQEDVINKFFEILSERMELVRKGLKIRYEACSKIKGKNSEILWVHGALARMGKEETVGDLMKKYPQRASISVGYVGLFETCMALIGESNTTEEGRKLSKAILTFMNQKCDEWKKEDNIGYAIYGTPEESLTYKFAMANRKDFGVIPSITDKDYVVNSYHVDPREHIDAFSKIAIEGEYLALSSGGAVSYVEIPDLSKNPQVVISIIQWMHEHIVYAEFNRMIGVCHKCGYEGDIQLTKTDDGDFKFVCPHCGNTDDETMDVTARLCGYLGKVNAGNTNKGRLDDIYHRVLHVDCKDEVEFYEN